MIQNRKIRIIALILLYIVTAFAFLGLNLYLYHHDHGTNRELNMNKMIIKSAIQGFSPIIAVVFYNLIRKKRNQ